MKAWLGAAIVTFAAGILYFATAARDIVVGDTPELITAAATLGVAHPPGYPLFTMLGHFFSLLPLGPIPFRVNLFSVVCDALAVGIVYLAASRLTKSQLAGAVAALLLAVNSNFWEWSLAAEVFPLNNLLAAILILLVVSWHETRERHALLIGAFFISGLAFTNQQTIVLLGPAFAFVLWQSRSALFARPALLAFGTLALLIGLLPYAYIPWASSHHPAHNWANISSFQDLVNLILRRSYGSTNLVNTPGYTGGPPWARLTALAFCFGPVSALLIIIGAIETFRRARWYFWFSLIAFLFAGPFFIWIANLNLTAAPSALFVLQRFFLLSQVALAPLAGFGVLALARFVRDALATTDSIASRIVTATCLVTVVISVAVNYRRMDLSGNSIARQFGEDVFKTAPPHSILLVSGDGLAFPLLYLQKVEHVGADQTLVVIPMLLGEWYVRQLRNEYPDLKIPFDRYDSETNNLKALVSANPDRVAAVVGTAGNDHSLGEDYWPYQQGLLIVIEPKSRDVPLEVVLSQNEQLFDKCHPPDANKIRWNTFETDILNVYTFAPFNVAGSCERVGLKNEARTWYQRALAVNPRFSPAHDAIARLEH